ncbi:MAG: hypothetical protein FWH55_14415 [Oscillospiraceae bacterium]|nr:hypothetical protein [Oscillospiraceae bacterium]
MKKYVLTREQFEVRKRLAGNLPPDYQVPGISLYYLDDLPEDDDICELFDEVIAAKTEDLEPFKVGDVVRVNIANEQWGNGHFVLVIMDATPTENGQYKYDGFVISTVNRLADGSYKQYDGSLVVPDFRSYLTDPHMSESRDVYINYANPIEFQSSGFSKTGVFKGHLDTDLVDFVTKLFAGEIPNPPEYLPSAS